MAKLINKTQTGFTIINNRITKDKTLSMKERGLLVTMLSLPDNWSYSVTGLSKILPEGKTSISATIKNLEEKGYIKREQAKDDNGLFAGYNYIISDIPLTENQTTEMAITENPSQYNTNKENTKKENIHLISSIQKRAEKVWTYEDLELNMGLRKNEISQTEQSIYNVILDVLNSNQEYYLINTAKVTTKTLQERIRRLDREDVKAIAEEIDAMEHPIKKIEAYIIKCLWVACSTRDLYWRQRYIKEDSL